MKRIMVFGTFDILHPGHISFLRQAKKLGDFLIVSLAREKFIKQIKGHKPLHSEMERKLMLENLKIVDKAVLGSRDDYIKHIVSQKPDIIALGYDQTVFTENLKQKLADAGLKKVKVLRLKSYRSRIYKTNKILKRF
ncbi:MAG: hypothetical protein A3C85_04315 [Candidatus Doudnabacteria bacterium RIFCSPHIGHO2_02_FULL_48_21]|uniref:Cytidyltransferase-like domain-containing protein n=1 Tax=Candidatus Doudnabacteria bacterium RIFCSPLOWO2_02_FULL_48_13 TaxID=1817845 RepID=A0A1F5QBC0_9BACT|nr:MAG: hypothetical protein A3K05_01000 [Candidatus Doudnabacteria bacterium RIFCSPHIGHO2_01_48_18]OGE78885.1 MAG: hypothetical protein A2668_00715 [Candidatus Doudnabacteria bacterium RIFCSPHIGHO2_01_FULL_48_180]OGE91876.1 MAG: hypothetical protein A3F44_04395 [Candidatus Doudnabacteria bacterium RIFCSPHIGHO2_12_FULL_47_25]OGE94113.1 MAG: hypothetical protein A3C85_04315 [Candidatus Doudnabacteria bacterium RIFCSPHIGHO2_02_FULL_48_21]OGE98181.1 MAG: hypothetical protein A3A83_03360 [Candidatu